jgi:hypothetical protein
MKPKFKFAQPLTHIKYTQIQGGKSFLLWTQVEEKIGDDFKIYLRSGPFCNLMCSMISTREQVGVAVGYLQ